MVVASVTEEAMAAAAGLSVVAMLLETGSLKMVLVSAEAVVVMPMVVRAALSVAAAAGVVVSVAPHPAMLLKMVLAPAEAVIVVPMVV